MANIIEITENEKRLVEIMRKSLQSANINFLIGSGCTDPAISVLGNIENKIQEKIDTEEYDEAEKLLYQFLRTFVNSVNDLISGDDNEDIESTLENYTAFLSNLSQILTERKNNILPKQATIFTTNYDLFIERASEDFGITIKLNDGFNRSPRLDNRFKFSASEFFNSTFNNGNLFNYRVEMPSINLIKLHGSLSWKKNRNEIFFSVRYFKKLKKDYADILDNNIVAISFLSDLSEDELLKKIKKFNTEFCLVLPKKDKFRDTLLNKIYYDLLRIFANELDKENTVLIAEGFSFADEHILEITQRALRNPTLKLIVFCYDEDAVDEYEEKFDEYNNVDILFSEGKKIDFERFNGILKSILPGEVSEVVSSVADEELDDD